MQGRSLRRAPFLRYHTMSAEHQTIAKCERCGLPFAEVDAYGERLRGCVGCNKWWELQSGERRACPTRTLQL